MRLLLDLVAFLTGAAVLGALGLSRAAVTGGGTPVVLLVAAVSAPLVLADVRDRLLPNALTAPILLTVLASTVGTALTGRVPGEVPAVVVTALALGLLHLAGGLGMGDVKLGAALSFPLAAVDPLLAAAGPVLAFLLAGAWSLPLALRGDRARIPFGPFQLAAFWLLLAGR